MAEATIAQYELLMELYKPEHGTTCMCDECTPIWEEHGLQDLVIQTAIDVQEGNAEFEARRSELATMRYRDYLQTSEWDFMRSCALQLAGYRCRICNSADYLNVHHREYPKVLGDENWSTDLTVLCRSCHYLFHQHGKLVRL